ncbi:MAG: NepR family anti-sigma factor [Methylovirgula sp.]
MTKPIEIKSKSAGASTSGRVEKLRAKTCDPNGDEQFSADISVLPVGRKAKGPPNPEMIDLIGHRLASIYNSVVSQPVPERFLDLLAQLEAGEQQVEAEKPAKKERK